jgi:uncharacterized membrane protein YeaQ/YmgE (transglycosylase-associated protein family)
MSLIGWLVLGLAAGLISSRIVGGRGEAIVLDMVLGVVGSLTGGYMLSSFGAISVRSLNISSMIVAAAGAAIVLLAYHILPGSNSRL